MKQKNKIPKKWKKEILKDIAIVFDGQHTTPKYVDYGIPFYSVENIVSGEPVKYISKEEYKINTKKNKPLKGDILISRIGTLCKNIIATWEGNYAIYVTLALIRSKVRDVSNKFLHQFFQTHMYNKDFFSKSLLIAYPQKINMEDLEKTSVLIPPIKEQEKIVDILELWDKAIETTKKLIEQKKLQKKYLMQKLLTGKIRLKGFKDKWEKKIVKDFGIVVTGNTPSKTNINYYGDVLPWVTAEDFSSKYILNTKIKLSELGKQQARVLPKGSVLITCIASIGLNAIAGTELATNQQINSIIPNKKYNSDFLYYLFSFNTSYIKDYASPGGLSILPKSVFEKIVFKIPTNIVEQKAIADILSTADKQIDLLKQKLSKLQLQKKGLMQKLLTGQIRVC